MRLSLNIFAVVAAAAGLVSAVSNPAHAECRRFGFTVNDYGKDGPTKDAKGLLDKLIASKMSERGVKDYNTGKKSVSCELFLNFIVFDEHTCTAEATVCWGGSRLPSAEQAAAKDTDESQKAAEETVEPKVEKKKKKDLAKKSDNSVATTKSAANVVPDPKPAPAHKVAAPVAAEAAEAPPVELAPVEAQPETPATATAQPESTPSDTSAVTPATNTEGSANAETAAAKTETPAARVETGSLSDTHEAHAKDKAKPAAKQKTPANASGGESGYPSPVPPQEPAE